MFSEFEVVPAVDVQDGQVVQLVGGERGTGTATRSRPPGGGSRPVRRRYTSST